MPVRRRKRRELLLEALEHVELLQQPVAGEAVRDGEARRVIGEHHVLVAELDRGVGHLLDRRAAV